MHLSVCMSTCSCVCVHAYMCVRGGGEGVWGEVLEAYLNSKLQTH